MTGINPRRWDRVYRDFTGKRFSVWNEKATPFFKDKIAFLKRNRVKKILDAGCGDGRNLLVFARSGFEMVGVDSSKKACELADRVVIKYPDTRVICEDLRNLENKDKYDAIICDYVLVHLENSEIIVKNLFNALKKKGYLLVEFLSTDDPSFISNQSVGKNAFVSHGIFHKFYSLAGAKKMLSKFKILEVKKIKHWDPDHVKDYPRSKRHQHDSIYVLCQKK